ncbi:hypothetical protein V8F20_012185 [Naviculisporaceae sp. PSN 640]
MVHIGEYWKPSFIVQGVWTVVAGIFVFLRLGTRYYLGPDRLGYDDWILLAAWLLFLCKAIITMSSFFPMIWGYTIMQYYMDPDFQLHYRAEILFGVSLFVGFLEEGLVRAAVAAFLYRLAVVRWHKIFLVTCTVINTLWSVVMAILFLEFFARYAKYPFFASHDTTTKPGYPYFIWTVVLDFVFALFPWYMFHNVHMKRSKKLLICCSLSLGLIAAGCGIVKVYIFFTLVNRIDAMYLHIFQTVERGVLYICISVPALLPIWTYFEEKRKKKALAQQSGQGGLPGQAQRNQRIKGDSVIRDPNMEELLIETVRAGEGQTMTSKTLVDGEGDQEMMKEAGTNIVSEMEMSDRPKAAST